MKRAILILFVVICSILARSQNNVVDFEKVKINLEIPNEKSDKEEFCECNRWASVVVTVELQDEHIERLFAKLGITKFAYAQTSDGENVTLPKMTATVKDVLQVAAQKLGRPLKCHQGIFFLGTF